MLTLFELDSQTRYALKQFSSLISDKTNSHEISLDVKVPKLTKKEISSLVRKSTIIQRLVYSFAKTGKSNDFSLNIKPEDFDNNKLKSYLDSIPVYTELSSQIHSYGILSAIAYADGLARKFGSAFLIFGFEDNENLDTPLNIQKVKNIKWIYIYECDRIFENIHKDHYLTANSLKIHKSRGYHLPGVMIDCYEEFIANQYKHDSCITGLFEAFAYWKIGIQSTSEAIESADMYSLGVRELGTQIKTNKNDGKDFLRERSSLLSRGKNLSKVWYRDLDNEALDNIARGNIQNLASNLESLQNFFAAHTDVPRYIIFNEFGSSNGLANNIESARILRFNWHSLTQEYCVDRWVPIIDYCIAALQNSFDIPLEYQTKNISPNLGLKLTDEEKIKLAKDLLDYYEKQRDLELKTVEKIQEELSTSSYFNLANFL